MEGTCGETVYAPGAWRSHVCGRKAKVEVNGKFYCGIHDPIRLKKIEDEKRAVYTAKWDRIDLLKRKDKLLNELGMLMIQAMANDGNTKYVAEDAKIKIVEYNVVINKLNPKQEVTNEE